MDSCSLRSQSQPHFHETDGFISQSQLTPENLSPALGLEFSEAWYIDWLIVYVSHMMQQKRLRKGCLEKKCM